MLETPFISSSPIKDEGQRDELHEVRVPAHGGDDLDVSSVAIETPVEAADRAHRIGQERPVMVYRLVAADTVEERILALQQRKREVAEAALGGADQAGGLTRGDLVDLLR